jgi:hypothetical protein
MPKPSCLAVLLLTALCFVSTPAQAVETSSAAVPAPAASVERVALTALIEQTIEAIYVTGDEAIIEKSVPPDYTIFLVEGSAFTRYTGAQMLADIRRSKAAGRYPIFPRLRYEVDVIGLVETNAVAQIRVFQDGVHTCSDFVLLNRLADGWKFVSLTTHHHADLKRS